MTLRRCINCNEFNVAHGCKCDEPVQANQPAQPFDLFKEADKLSKEFFEAEFCKQVCEPADLAKCYRLGFRKALELIEAHFKEEWKFYSDTKFFELQKFINKLKSGGR